MQVSEANHLSGLPLLEELYVVGNPIKNASSYRSNVFSYLTAVAEKVHTLQSYVSVTGLYTCTITSCMLFLCRDFSDSFAQDDVYNINFMLVTVCVLYLVGIQSNHIHCCPISSTSVYIF